MLLWGFIFLVAGLLTDLILFLCNLDLFSKISALGFGGYIHAFFDKSYLTTAKTIFLIGAVAIVLGLVLYIIGRAKSKREGEDKQIIPNSVKKFFRDCKGEFKKIVWPTFPSVAKSTFVTLVMCAITGVVIVAFDAGLSALVRLLTNL
mgnify:CR=1 FL=1